VKKAGVPYGHNPGHMWYGITPVGNGFIFCMRVFTKSKGRLQITSQHNAQNKHVDEGLNTEHMLYYVNKHPNSPNRIENITIEKDE
jgi:hypothetical protein